MRRVEADHHQVVAAVVRRAVAVGGHLQPGGGAARLIGVGLPPAALVPQKDRQRGRRRLGAVHPDGLPRRACNAEGEAGGPRLLLHRLVPPGGYPCQPDLLLAAGLGLADPQPPQPVCTGLPVRGGRQQDIAAPAQGPGLVRKGAQRAALAVFPRFPAEGAGGLRLAVGRVAPDAVRLRHVEPQPQRPFGRAVEAQQQPAVPLPAEGEGLKGRLPGHQPRHAEPLVPALHQRLHKGGADGGDGLSQFKQGALGRLQPAHGRAGLAVGGRFQRAEGGAGGQQPQPCQRQQLLLDGRRQLIHLVLLHFLVPGHQLQNGDARVVGIVVGPDRAQPRQPALGLRHNLVITLVVQPAGNQHRASSFVAFVLVRAARHCTRTVWTPFSTTA